MPVDLNQAAQTNFGNAARSVRMAPSKAFWRGASAGTFGAASGVLMVAHEAATAQRGEVVPTTLGRSASLVTYPALAGTIAAGTSTLAAVMGLSIPLVGPLACIAALYPDAVLGNSVSRAIRGVTDLGRQIRHLEFGGHYTDTETAQRLRMQAFYEMSGATSAARRYLGQEAYFLHR